MICTICGFNETDNPDDICKDSKFSIISDENISLKDLEGKI